MHLYRARTEVQVRGNLFVRETFCDETEDRMLPGRETDCGSQIAGTFRERRRRSDSISLQAIQKRSKPEPALAKGCCEMAARASRRDTAIVAWHEVPGKASFERTVP